MKSMRALVVLAGFLAYSHSGMQAMDRFDADGDSASSQTPTPKQLRRREGWQAPSPQLRKRNMNSAQLNNCGYVEVIVSLQAPFSDGIQAIMNGTKLKGEVVAPENQYLVLFTFNVPITNDLLSRMPKRFGFGDEAKNLSPDEKAMIANQIKDATIRVVDNERMRYPFYFDLEEVILDDGKAHAYFVATPGTCGLRLSGFEIALKAIRAELEKEYRWGKNNQDGIWFNFENTGAVRPALFFLTTAQSGLVKLQRGLTARLSPRLLRNSSRESAQQSSMPQSSPPSSSSRAEMLSRDSAGESVRPMIASHRVSGVSSSGDISPNRSPNRSPTRSPEASPRDSLANGRGSLGQSFGSSYWGDSVRRLDVTGNRLRIDTKIIEIEAGKC